MKRAILMPAMVILCAVAARAEKMVVSDFDTAASVQLADLPVFGRETETYKTTDPLEMHVTAQALAGGDTARGRALRVATFAIENRVFTSADIKAEGAGDRHALYCDGEKVGGTVKLHPGTHNVMIKYVTEGDTVPEVRVTIETAKDGAVRRADPSARIFTLDDVMCGVKLSGASVSADGTHILADYRSYRRDGRGDSYQRLFDTKTGKPLQTLREHARWMPDTGEYFVERNDYEHGRMIVAVDPATGAERLVADHIPDGHYTMSPTGDYLVYMLEKEGRKESKDIYEIVDPEDRQPGYRDRGYLAVYRFDTGVLMPVTAGNAGVSLLDITDDGKKMLLMSSRQRFTERPTTLNTITVLDLSSLRADTIVSDDGFVSGACFSPDGSKVAVTGGPEAFSRIGCTLPDDVTPSTYDNQLFVLDLGSREVTPLTRDFNPSVNDMAWSRHDGRIYMTVTDRDRYLLYAADPATGRITLVPTGETVVLGVDAARRSPVMAYWGQSASNPTRLYSYNARTGKSAMLDAPSDTRLSDVSLGRYVEWNFLNSRGDSIYGGYYLPDDFDPQKKYPLIVNYYGGCTPSTRLFESRYPFHVYSPLGYVVYVVNPSGATGFGQEFSSRHVSTAGKGVAEDIIEGTEAFLAAHPFVDRDRVGCIGASYGGFMTQYLQTQTDLFAAAVSHAGISDHTSYWGEGYWGYSYSETSMGADKPWTTPDLYVKQSPLYNADKIKTPILFLHGDSDTNVPPGESIQMFTALKLLGVPTALVMVNGQNHHINDFDKRRQWQDTILAWFAKYLQGDDEWWLELYPDKEL